MPDNSTHSDRFTDEDIALAYVDMPVPGNQADAALWYATYFELIRAVFADRISSDDQR